MKQNFLIICLFFSYSLKLKAQSDYFDTPTISALIEQNKTDYNNHKVFRNNQILTQTSANSLKTSTTKMKVLVDNIDKKMNSIFIITADISTTIHIYSCIDQVLASQITALKLVAKYPWLALWVTKYEENIVASANDLLRFCMLMVSTYGNMNKISVGDRKQIYNELDHQLSKIVIDANGMVYELQMIDLNFRIENSAPSQIINHDKKLIAGIMKSFKF